jgi:hypothetical protein
MAVAALPAALTGVFVLVSVGDEYYRPVEVIASSVYLVASVMLALVWAPAPGERTWQVGLRWLLIGVLAWSAALGARAGLSLTPLCVGQDNGDGVNDLGLCMLQVAVVGLVCTPIELALIAATSVGGALLSTRVRRWL